MLAMGIDIGTTTISIIMVDEKSGKLVGSRTIESRSFVEGRGSFSREQDPEKIWSLTMQGIEELTGQCGKPDSIGLTGQMHGMLYLNQEGKAVSNLFTWQDASGNEILKDGKSCAEILRSLGVKNAAAGYGLTTHYYHVLTDSVPEEAVSMTTISDYIGLRLCGLSEAVIGKEMAASWGCFDLENGCFDQKKIKEIGIRPGMLPTLLKEHSLIGRAVQDPVKGVPVMISLGDNQASFLGSVRDVSGTVLVNIGTGSQVSYTTDHYCLLEGSIELRPLSGASYLMAGSTLCGGRAYAMLENFYREIAQQASGMADGSLSFYQMMEEQAREFLKEKGKEAAWKVCPTFAGSRSNPKEKGRIEGIGTDNFCPGALTVGIMSGMIQELYDMYRKMSQAAGIRAAALVGSGNALRQNPILRQMAEEIFGMKMAVPACKEEAAFGAALHSLYAAGFAADLSQVQNKIAYI